MSSPIRRLQRRSVRSRVAWARKFIKDYGSNPDLCKEAEAVLRMHSRPQYTETLPNGGYRTLRPTKGFATFSGARLRAMSNCALLKLGINPFVAAP